MNANHQHPRGARIRPGAERVRDREHVDDDRHPVGPYATREGRSAGGRRRRGRGSRRGSRRPCRGRSTAACTASGNGTEIPPHPGCSQASPSSVTPCTAIATSPATARCSCRALKPPLCARLLRQAAGHRQSEHHGRGDQQQRHQAGGATGQPPRVVCYLRGCHAIAGAFAGFGGNSNRRRGVTFSGPAISTRPLSWTSRPPRSASTSRPASTGQQRGLESVSASRAVLASAVAPINPVQTGSPSAGSRR